MNIDNLKIQSGIPVPEPRRRGLGLAVLFRQMKPGDSVFIPIGDQKPGTLSSCCHSAAKNSNIRVTIRKTEECPVCGPSCKSPGKPKHFLEVGFRTWRVEDDTPVGKRGPRVK